MNCTPTGVRPVAAPPAVGPIRLPVVAAVAHLPIPGHALVNITADHSDVCGHWHRHVSAHLDGDDLIRWPPCRIGGPYRLAVIIASRAAVSVRGRAAS